MVSGCDSDVRFVVYSFRFSFNVSFLYLYSVVLIGSVVSSFFLVINGFVVNGICIDNGFEVDNV